MDLSSSYAALWVKSCFSFLEGASHPADLIDKAHALGLDAVALTDRDGLYGIVEAHERAKELGIKLLVGAQVSVAPTDRVAHSESTVPTILLATNRHGYGQLTQLISRGRAASPKGSSIVTMTDVMAFHEDLVALAPSSALLEPLGEVFGDRLYALVTRHRAPEERRYERELRHMAAGLGIPTVAGVEVLYHDAARRPLQDTLTCIRHGTTLSEAGRLLRPNAEHALLSPKAMQKLFADDPDSLARTLDVAARCTFSLSELRYRYPTEWRPDGTSEEAWLRKLTFDGARARYGDEIPSEVTEQIERELALISELDYGGYFLTMDDIVSFCRRESILCQGRGSAANSVVCYCLGITAIDPVQLDLLFERFISRERAEPPDIDLDIEHGRREEVIQYVYERYGRRRAAMVAVVIRYRTKSAVRDVGKALGLSPVTLELLARLVGSRYVGLDDEALAQAGLDPQAATSRLLVQLVGEIRELPRHLSIHPGGFLLGHEPVDTFVPIEPGTMPGRTVIQWDKYAVEALGLFKVDLLGLGALTQLRLAFELMGAHHGVHMEMARIPSEDPATYEMISQGDTVGVFQIESRAQMSMLPRLKPRTFYDLVIEVAIMRPGPIQGNMVHPYLRRRRGEEEASYPHPKLERVLGKTLGVPIFQEQVMKIAMLVGGYTPGEADQLRRDMAAWRSVGRIERHRERLIGRMIEGGLPPDFAEQIFSQIRGFGEYGFPESHAASFALIAYAAAWVKRHYPEAFLAGLLNAQPMGFYAPATLVDDAKRHGVEVLPIDIKASTWPCTLERTQHGVAVRMGFSYVKGLTQEDRERLDPTKCAREPCSFATLSDFIERTRLPLASLLKLAEAGAFESLGLHRRTAIWELRKLVAEQHDTLRAPVAPSRRAQLALFDKLSNAEEVLWDYRASLHSTRGHPMLTVRPELTRRKLPTAIELNAMEDGKKSKYVGLVICRQQPGTATGVTFYTLEDETGLVNLVVWRDTFERYSVLARTALLMGVTGRVQSEDGVVHLMAEKLWDPELSLRPEGTKTRSFY